jgi:hypothetical protein
MADVGGLPEIPLARPAREDCTHRRAHPLRRLDRRGAGADRSRITALASQRLAYDAGRMALRDVARTGLPDWLDESIETRHADLTLAILSAFVEAQLVSLTEGRIKVPPGQPDRARPL